MYQFVRENLVAADSQRRRNNDSFPRSAAEGKWVLFRSQQRRLRLSTVAATRQQQCNLPDLQPASSHLVWPAERKHVAHPPTRDSFLAAGRDFQDIWCQNIWHIVLPQILMRFGAKKPFGIFCTQALRSQGVKVKPGVSVNPVWIFWWSHLSSEVVRSIEPTTTN